MRLTLQAFGGLAAGMRRPAVHVDLDEIDAAAGRRITALLSLAQRGMPSTPAAAAPDEMSYRVTAERAGRVDAVEGSDSTMTPEFAELLALLRAHGAPEPR
jgi:hypothetical protein